MLFATAYLELFHCTHHPVVPKSDLYFYFLFYLKCVFWKNIKLTVDGLINGFGKWNETQHASKWSEINVRFALPDIQGVLKNCENPAHTKPLFWKYFQGAGCWYIFIYGLSLIVEDLHWKSLLYYACIVWSHEKKDSQFILFYYYSISKCQNFLCFVMFWIPSKVMLRQYDLLEHVK